MINVNINNQVVIYPSDKGWDEIVRLTAKNYNISLEKAVEWVKSRKTDDGGYKDQLWVIMSDLHDIFYLGNTNLKNSTMSICND